MAINDYHIVLFSETWLNSDIGDGELGFSDYTIYRCDRSTATSSHERGGGVLIAVGSSLSARKIQTSCLTVEHLFITTSYFGLRVLFGLVYFPPKSSAELYEAFCNSLEEATTVADYDKIIICGDFNLPSIAWDNDDYGIIVGQSAPLQACSIIDCFAFLNLFQINNIKNAFGSLLDLVFSNDSDITVNLSDSSLLPCDKYHPAIIFNLSLNQAEVPYIESSEYEYYNFKLADYIGLNICLSNIDWNLILNDLNVNEALNTFYYFIFRAIELYVPKLKAKTKKFPEWYSQELKSTIVNKKISHKNWKLSKSLVDYQQFAFYRAQCKEIYNICHKNHIDMIQSNISNDCKEFWRFVHSKKKNSDLPSSMSYDDCITENPHQIADLFSDHFGSVYEKLNFTIPNCDNDGKIDLNNCDITVTDVFNSISNLKSNLGPGPDGLPVLFFKNCQCVLSLVLFKLFKLSLESSTYPDFWKLSFVTPVFKSGDKCNIKNYRPISKMSILAKLLDSIISKKISPIFYNALSTNQHGFIQGRSTSTNLLLFVESLSDALEKRQQIDVAYTDFSKAFDRVQHTLLINKLRSFGVHGTLLLWFESYLSNRTQIVRIKHALSKEISVDSGVPQGAHLATLLFDLFIDELTNKIKYCKCLLYADDLKLFININDFDDCSKLQHDLDIISEWSLANGMSLNVEKCKILTVSKKKYNYVFDYCINDKILGRVNEIKDLGVYIDGGLRFDYHINYIKNKAMKLLGFISRTLRDFSDINCFRVLYCSYVRSILEYASPVWSPQYNVYIESLDKIQKKFFRLVAFKLGIPREDIDYNSMENLLNLNSLKDRRVILDLSTLYKIVNNMFNCSELLDIVSLNVPQRFTRDPNLFSVKFHRTNYGMHSPLTRLCRLANDHCKDIDFFCTSFRIFHNSLCRMPLS